MWIRQLWFSAHLRSSSSSGAIQNANEQNNATEEALKTLLDGLDGSEEETLESLRHSSATGSPKLPLHRLQILQIEDGNNNERSDIRRSKRKRTTVEIPRKKCQQVHA